MDVLWSAHMMLAASEGGRHLPPEEMNQIVTTYSQSGLIGGYGDVNGFPLVKRGGNVYDASTLRAKTASDFQKFYFSRKCKGAYRYEYPSGNVLELTTSESAAYLAAINAEGGAFDVHCAYIEPCTAPFDSIQAANVRGLCDAIKAKSDRKWWIRIALS